MVQRSQELVEVASSVVLNNETDALVWQYEKSSQYSTTFYYVINFRGVTPMFVPAVWTIEVPPKIQMFLWLLAHNKLMTTDNLLKRGIIKPKSCQFCCEDEYITHLFFECVVAKYLWELASRVLSCRFGESFENIATKWLESSVVNVTSSAAGHLVDKE